MRVHWLIVMVLMGVYLAPGAIVSAEERFPPPDFESGYRTPETAYPPARATSSEMADVAVLVLALSAAAWLALKRRSRKGLFVLSIFSLAYFGFYRAGCVCPIGAIQDVSLALADSRYILPVTGVLFFSLPLLYALLFGRRSLVGLQRIETFEDVLHPLR